MAKHKPNTRALAVFAEVITVKVDGEDIRVPRSPEANQSLNCLLVSQLRHMMHENLKRIKDLDQPISPREMKDLIDSMARLTEASRDVYKTLEDIDDGAAKPAERVEDEEVIEADFKTITQTDDNRTNPSVASATAPEAPDPTPATD